MKSSTMYLALFLMFAVSSCKSNKVIRSHDSQRDNQGSYMNFESSALLGDVLDKAKKQNKIVFIDFYADWCLPCKLMDEDVFSDKPMADFMNENFVNYKIDAEKGHGPDLAQLYNIQAYPTLLFLDTNGRVLVRKAGTAYHTELRRMANEALSLSANG